MGSILVSNSILCQTEHGMLKIQMEMPFDGSETASTSMKVRIV